MLRTVVGCRKCPLCSVLLVLVVLVATPGRCALPVQPSPLLFRRACLFRSDPLFLSARPDTSGVFLIQFSGPLERSWLSEVSELGARLLEFVPEHTYVAQASSEVRAAVARLPYVIWVGPYPAVLRVHPSLDGAQGVGRLSVGLFRTAQPGVTSQLALLWGFRVLAARRRSLVVEGDLSQAELLASLPGVSWVEPGPRMQFLNDRSRAILGVPTVWKDRKLYGAGQVVAITDTGLDTGDFASLNADFQGRVKWAAGLADESQWRDVVGHGTHVAGSIVGTGLHSGANPSTRQYSGSFAGMAPEAEIVVQASQIDPQSGQSTALPDDLSDLFTSAYDQGARIHNNSWGDSDTPRGDYSLHCQQVDQFVWDHPDYSVLFAAGNDGTDPPPTDPVGGPGPLPGDVGAPSDIGTGRVAMGSLYAPGSAKDCISVGASEGYRPPTETQVPSTNFTWGLFGFTAPPIKGDYVSDNPEGMVAFSSRGPTLDGRVKPDLVAPGSNIASVRSAYIAESAFWYAPRGFYVYAGGTSMACAFASGAAALLRQHLMATMNHVPSAALLKAVLLNTAHDITPGQYGTGQYQEVPARPNSVEGWGRVNLLPAVGSAPGIQVGLWDDMRGVSTGDRRRFYSRVASSEQPLRVTLAWSDYPGTPAAGKALVNDLDLVVTAPDGSRFVGNGFTDRLNNVEGVDIRKPAPGIYTIEVSAQEVATETPQIFSLVASGGLGTSMCLRSVGDLDGDGTVGIADVVRVLRLVLGLEPETLESILLGDVAPAGSPDGQLSIADAVRLLKLVVGLDAGTWP